MRRGAATRTSGRLPHGIETIDLLRGVEGKGQEARNTYCIDRLKKEHRRGLNRSIHWGAVDLNGGQRRRLPPLWSMNAVTAAHSRTLGGGEHALRLIRFNLSRLLYCVCGVTVFRNT